MAQEGSVEVAKAIGWETQSGLHTAHHPNLILL